MNCNMQIDRRLVHRALEALLDADATRDDYQDVQLRREVIKDLRKVLYARDEQDTSQVPEGFVLLQTEKGKPIYAACLDGGRFHGWLLWMLPDGQWVSKRKLEQWEIMQAEDQRDSGIVQGD